MLASLKKRAQETEPAVTSTMEAPQSSASLQDPSPSPLEVPEESTPREQPLGNPRTESLDTEMILQHLRESQAGQDSLLSEMDDLRTSISQMNRWLREAESRFSSLEARARESQQTNQIVSASQSEPRAVPAASSSSISDQQMILDAAQTAASPGCASTYTGDASTEPTPPPSSEQFRATSSSMMYSETEENAYQMLAAAWYQETSFESGTARIEAGASGNQEDTSSGPSPLMALTSTEERALPKIAVICSLERISEIKTAHIKAEESDNQEDTFTRASPLMAPECKTEPEALTSTEGAARPTIPAKRFPGRISESQRANKWAEETDQQEDIFSRALEPCLAPEYERDPHPWISTEEAALPIFTAGCFLQRIPESETALTKAEETYHQEDTSITMPSLALEYETEPQAWISTEEAALPIIAAGGFKERVAESETAHTEPEGSDHEEDNFSGGFLQVYKPQQQPLTSTLPKILQLTAVAPMQTEAPRRATQSSRRRPTHTRSSSAASTSTPSKHRRTSIAWDYFTSQSKFRATCNLCGTNVQTGKIGGCGNVGTAALLSHLKCKHGIDHKKVAPSGLPAASSRIQDVERPSSTKGSSRTIHQWASIAWLYFTSESRFLATCNVCKKDVQIGKLGGCGKGGAIALLRHLKHEHGILQGKAEPSVLPGGGSQNQDVNTLPTSERLGRTTLLASASTATSPGTLSCPSSPPRADARPPTKCRRRRSVAWQYFTKQSKFMATCRLCEEDVPTGKIGGCHNWGTIVLFRHLKCKHGIAQGKVAPSVLPGAGSEIQDAERPSSTERPSRTTLVASASTAACSVTLCDLSLPPPADARPPTKRQRRTSMAWQYFTKQSKFMATCNLCGKNVQTGKVGGCSNWGTGTLLLHLRRKHGITQKKVVPSMLPGARSEIQDMERPSATERPRTTKRRRTSIAWRYFMKLSKFIAICNLCEEEVQTGKIGGCHRGTVPLLRHLKREHGIPQEKVAPSVLPGARSEIQDVKGPSTTDRPSTSAASSATSIGTATSTVTLSCLPSSPPGEVRPPTKRQRGRSIVWQYFKKLSKFTATCNLCEEEVQIGKIGGCGRLGTSALLSHLKRIHPKVLKV